MRKSKKRITSILLAASMMLAICGCGKKNGDTPNPSYESGDLLKTIEAEPAPEVELDDDFVSSSMEFSVNIFKECAANDIKEGKNVMVSPVSIQTCLGMTANGAKDDTLTQMEQVICPGLDIGKLNSYLCTFNNKLIASNGEDVKFNVGNSIWIRDDEERISVNEDFLKTDKKYYNASAYKEEFDDSTKDKINKWVEDNTEGMIKEVLSEISEDVVMYLINAIAFEAEWQEEYKDSQVYENETFTNYNGGKENATMLYSVERYYCETEKAKAVVKNYKGGQYAFVGILPNEDIDICDYVDSLTGEELKKLMDSKTAEYEVLTHIPEFSYDWGMDISPCLQMLGMTDAFMDYADFSNMADTKSGYLYIGRVIHKTHIELDRNGTKASAVTVVEMKDEASCEEPPEMKEVILDRPFVYAIIDNETNIPIFIGVVNTLN